MAVALLKNSPAYIFEKTSNITIVLKTLDKQNWKVIFNTSVDIFTDPGLYSTDKTQPNTRGNPN